MAGEQRTAIAARRRRVAARGVQAKDQDTNRAALRDAADVADGLSIPDELARREDRLSKLARRVRARNAPARSRNQRDSKLDNRGVRPGVACSADLSVAVDPSALEGHPRQPDIARNRQCGGARDGKRGN